MSRVLGIDHGSRRIGLAVGDTETGLAFARPALRRRGAAQDAESIRELADREAVTTLVIGLPLNMDGSEGSQAQAARAFGARLKALGLGVEFRDERLTTWQATEEVGAGGRLPDRRSGEIDSAAARILLQEYLDARRPQPPPDEETA